MASDAQRASTVDRRVAGWLAVVAALAYLPFNHCHFSGTDETGVFESARALVLHGNMAIAPGQHIFRGRDGRHYSHFAPGQSLLVLPLVALGETAARALPSGLVRLAIGRQDDGFIDTREDPAIFLASLYAPLASGALVGLFYLFERRLGATRRAALLASGLLAVSTYVATLSVFFLCHVTEAIAILGALAALHRWRRTRLVRWLALGTLCASSIVLIRVPAAVAGPVLAGYLGFTLLERSRASPAPAPARIAAAILVPGIAVAAAHLGLNHARWGTWIASPMLAQSFLLRGSLLDGLHGLLLSPGASLFVYSPPLLLLPLTLPHFWRSQRAECAAVLALSASFLLLCGRFVFWHGLWSAPGPRYLFALTPLLMLPLGPWLDTKRSDWQRALMGVLAASGCVAQLVLMSVVWSRAAERIAYPQSADFGFLFEPLRSPIIAGARALLDGEVDVYLWALGFGVPGREPQPLLAVALLAVWAVAFAGCLVRLRSACIERA